MSSHFYFLPFFEPEAEFIHSSKYFNPQGVKGHGGCGGNRTHVSLNRIQRNIKEPNLSSTKKKTKKKTVTAII